jgi:hypothetical protein
MIHVQRCPRIFGLALGVGNGAAQHLLDIARSTLLGEAQNLQRILGALASD